MFFEQILKKKFDLNNFHLDKFQLYYLFLKKYNEKINLTSLITKKNVYFKHFYDSLLISKTVNFQKITHLCDLGAGAGFPSIPLKILFPHLKIFLIDSSNKKISFLKELFHILDLSYVFLFPHKIEKHNQKYNFVITRALGKLDVILKLSSFVTKKKGYFIAMKGPNYLEELKKVKRFYSFSLKETKEFYLPDNLGQRFNLLFQKN
jgi:16S rRNA (guanine527-N7)-methyltransferase